MFKSRFLLFIFVFASLILAQPTTAQTSPIVIATFDQAAPRLIASELVMKEIYKKLNIEMQLDKHPGNRALSLADGGKVDGELLRTPAIESITSNLVRIPTPIAHINYTAYTKKAKTFTINDWNSLKPYKVGIIRGIKLVEERSRFLNPDVISAPQSLFKMLYLERTDVVVFTEFDGLFMLKKVNLHNEITKLSPPLEVVPTYHYLHRKNPELIKKLSALMQEMEASGELQALIKRSETTVIDSLP